MQSYALPHSTCSCYSPFGSPGSNAFGAAARANPFGGATGGPPSPFGPYGANNPFAPNFTPSAATTTVDTTATPVTSQATVPQQSSVDGGRGSSVDGGRGDKFNARRASRPGTESVEPTNTAGSAMSNGGNGNGAGMTARMQWLVIWVQYMIHYV